MFSPDGRLLQVEYASRAAVHSSPLVILRDSEKGNVIIITRKSSHSSQDRLVVFGANNIVCMSGVLADSLALLSVVQREMEKELRSFGSATTLSCLKIATILGNACQSHAFGGGLRPYGSTMVVCGLDGIYQTDPSGSVVRCMMNNERPQLLVVGGSETRQAQVKSELQKRVLSKSKDTDLSETLQRIAKILLQADVDDKRQSKRQWLEVALISPIHGVHRLTDPQMQSLIEAVDKMKS